VGVAARPSLTLDEAQRHVPAPPEGIDELKTAIQSSIKTRGSSNLAPPFLFYVDHCFAVKGQGTVLTGTVASGRVKVGDTIELPAYKQCRRVKSMQCFREPVASAEKGDRVGICVTQLDAGSIERGIACAPGTVPTFSGALALVEKVRFYPGTIPSLSKLHIIVGHCTAMAKVQFFGALTERSDGACSLAGGNFDFEREYIYQEELYGRERKPSAQWAYIDFEGQHVTAPANALLIGARLDADLNAASCRVAFSGKLCAFVGDSSTDTSSHHHQLAEVRVCKLKTREGVIERIESDGCTAICRGMFSKDSDLSRFVGMQIIGPGGLAGILQGRFGKSGKFRVRFEGPLTATAMDGSGPLPVRLVYKRYIYDPDKRRMLQ